MSVVLIKNDDDDDDDDDDDIRNFCSNFLFLSLSLLLFPEHGDIQNASYTAQRQTDLSLQKLYLCFITSLSHVAIKLRQFLKIFIQHTVVAQIRKEKMLQSQT